MRIPVTERHNEAHPSQLLGLDGSMLWRRIVWREPPRPTETGTAPSKPPATMQAPSIFVSLEPAYWMSASKELPLMLVLFPPFEPKRTSLPPETLEPLPKRFRLLPLTLHESSKSHASSDNTLREGRSPSGSLATPPSPEHIAACAKHSAGGAIAGWLCLAHGQGSPLTAHTEAPRGIVPGPAPGMVHDYPVGLPLFTEPPAQPVACEAARLPVCVAGEQASGHAPQCQGGCLPENTKKGNQREGL